MPNYLELRYGKWVDHRYPDNPAWHRYSDDGVKRYGQFHDRMNRPGDKVIQELDNRTRGRIIADSYKRVTDASRGPDKVIQTVGNRAEGKELLEEIRALSESRYEIEEDQEQEYEASYMCPSSKKGRK